MQVVGRGDAEIARIAGAQRGYVTRAQLLAAGIGRGAISHRLGTGRLRKRYRAVYLVGRPSVEPLGEEMAAILHFGGHAILSHRTAAAVWGLVPSRPDELTLTIVARDRHPPAGVRLCRVASLDRRDLRTRSGLPLTAPARTLLDLAGEASDTELEQAIAEARVRTIARDDEIKAAAMRAPGRKGTGRLQRLLDLDGGPAFTRSRGERRMLALLRAAELPPPLVNVHRCGYNVDFLWERERLIVEVDGHAFHGHRVAFERDRRRDQTHVAAGYRVIRVTWRQLLEEPFAVIARIAQALIVLAA